MTDSFPNSERRTPLQGRACRRIETILAAAEQVFAKSGYEAATMADISHAAKTSPGGLYRYFSDKPSVARALLADYDDRIERRWLPILECAGRAPIGTTVAALLDALRAFSAEHPAFLALLAAPIRYRRADEAKKGLRARLSRAFGTLDKTLPTSDILVIANVFVETVKGMLTLLAGDAAPPEEAITAHYQCLLTRYLEETLGQRSSGSEKES